MLAVPNWESDHEGMLLHFPAGSFGVLFQNPDRWVNRCELCQFIRWVLPPVWFGFVQQVHVGHRACRRVVEGLGGDAVDRVTRYGQEFGDVFDEVVV